VRRATPILRGRLRPLVRRSQPLTGDLAPATRQLSAVTPKLSGAFQVLTYLVNELAYNPPGRDEGFLFWAAWFAHNTDSIMSAGDANGAVFRGLALGSCSTLTEQPGLSKIAGMLSKLLPICQKTGGQ
jgi:phospholipid/cholesterol/gamma-HCH transport system substrate-binding protein